jgi:hypothetical protein
MIYWHPTAVKSRYGRRFSCFVTLCNTIIVICGIVMTQEEVV